jgi:hypothetical protein
MEMLRCGTWGQPGVYRTSINGNALIILIFIIICNYHNTPKPNRNHRFLVFYKAHASGRDGLR